MYLHIYIRVYIKCLYKWGRWPACTLGTLAQEILRVRSVVSHSCQGVKPQAVSLKTKSKTKQRAAGEQLQRWLPAQTHGTDLGWGKEGRVPRGGMQEYKTQWDKRDACTRTDCTRTGMR